MAGAVNSIPRPDRPRLRELIEALRARARWVHIVGAVFAILVLLAGVIAAAQSKNLLSLIASVLVAVFVVMVADYIARWLQLTAERIDLDVNCEQLLWHIATKR